MSLTRTKKDSDSRYMEGKWTGIVADWLYIKSQKWFVSKFEGLENSCTINRNKEGGLKESERSNFSLRNIEFDT